MQSTHNQPEPGPKPGQEPQPFRPNHLQFGDLSARSFRAAPVSLREELLDDVDLVLCDLDYTLTVPNGMHSGLIREVFSDLGVTDLSIVSTVMAEVRGRPYERIFQAIVTRCIEQTELRCTLEEAWERSNQIVAEIVAGAREFEFLPIALDGAREMIELIGELGRALKICTASPRAFANLSIDSAGLSDLLNGSERLCAEDSEFPKSAPEYWVECARGVPLNRTVVFEDRVAFAKAALDAGIKKVFLKPSRDDEDLAGLLEQFPDRLVPVQSWTALLEG